MSWQPIKTAPKGEMFIYAKPGNRGNWAIGLAYHTVSGTNVDHLTAVRVDSDHGATHWHPLPEPPK